MADFHIVFDGNKIALPDGYNLGVQGEHNATRLVIALPETFCAGADFYVVNLGGKMSAAITSEKNIEGGYIDGSTIYQPLTSAYTGERSLSVSVAAFLVTDDGDNEIIRCTRTVYGLILRESTLADGSTNAGIAIEVNEIKKAQHTHPNKPTLDRLTEADGVLYLDGNRLGGVVVWHIVDDPVNVPSMDDGTLLFISPGINGDMSYPPYKVMVLGSVVTKIAPWKPGQLWVCRGGVWFLLATANRQEYTPEEVVPDEVLPEYSDIPQDVGGSVTAEEEVYEVDPCENVDKSGGIVEAVKTLRAEAHTHSNLEALEKVEITDDLVLLPFGESINLSIRVILEEAHFYLTCREEVSPVYSAEIISTDGRHINLTCGNGECYAKYTNGSNVFKYVDSWKKISGTEELPNLKEFTIERFSDGYSEADNIDHLKQDYILFDKFKVFCQCFRADTTLTNFNGLYIAENRVEALGRWVFCDNRSYVSRIDAASFYVDAGAQYVGDFIVDGYSVLYIDLARDCDVVINNISFYVGGEVPNTKAGKHKWIFNETPKGQVSLGALDLEAVV